MSRTRFFRDRTDAGRKLAAALVRFKDESPVVLGLPRGGLPVALEVSRALDAPLDVWVVRKLGAPIHEELGMGAVAEGGEVFIDPSIVASVGATEEDVRRVVAEKTREVNERRARFRGGRPAPSLSGRTVLLVDDGIATGGTARAALRAIRRQEPKRLVLAVPVGSTDTLRSLADEADEVICLEPCEDLVAVGLWYQDFRPVDDETVIEILEGAGHRAGVERAIEIDVGEAPLRGDLSIPDRAHGLVLFAHGSGSSRRSPRNRQVAAALQRVGIGTLLFDLLTPEEETVDEIDGRLRFDIPLLARRLFAATSWVRKQPMLAGLPIGYFGASTGAAAALLAASERRDVSAIVSRGGRPDLAGRALHEVKAPTLFIVGGDDTEVLSLNRAALARMKATTKLEIVPGASHLFEEPGALERVGELAGRWFVDNLAQPGAAHDMEAKVEQDDETEDLVQCIDCGELIDPAVDRAFAISTEDFLCFSCSELRGGVYDEEEDRWTTAPDLTDEHVREKARRYVRRSAS
jgi:putative phosphoribosyl transferase